MVIVAITVVSDPVLVAQVENIPELSLLKFQIDVPQPLPPSLSPIPPPIYVITTFAANSATDSSVDVSYGFGIIVRG